MILDEALWCRITIHFVSGPAQVREILFIQFQGNLIRLTLDPGIVNAKNKHGLKECINHNTAVPFKYRFEKE